jgi:signal transduction histidine kinase
MFRSDVDVMREVRERGARAYLLIWRPLVVVLTGIATTIVEIVDGDVGEPMDIAVIWSSLLVVGAFAALVLAGVNARRLAMVVIALDIPILLMWAHASERPDPAFATFCGTIAIAAWLLSSRAAVLMGVAAITVVLAYYHLVDAWVPSPIPEVVWTIFGTTVLAAAISFDLERSFRRASLALAQAEQDAREIARSRRRLVADVSHELRTPLTAILGFIDTYLRRDIEIADGDRRELLLHARRGGVRLERLVEDLLDLERGTQGVLQLSIEHVRIGAMVETAVGAVPVPPERQVVVEIAPELALDHVAVDEHRLGQALGNLVANALRHGAGAVTVTCEAVDGKLRIDVGDEGPGLPDGASEQAFEPFASYGGNSGSAGLGLAIARTMVGAHRGTLTYVADDGHGRHAFRIELPFAGAVDPSASGGRVRTAP